MKKEKLIEFVEAFDKVIELLGREPKNYYEIIFQKYIEFESIEKVMRYLNENGYRVEGVRTQRKFTCYDIKNVFESEESRECVNEELYNLTTELKRKSPLSWEQKIINYYSRKEKNLSFFMGKNKGW